MSDHPSTRYVGDEPISPRFAPRTSNWHQVKVLDPDDQEGGGGCERLRVQ